MCRNAHPGGWDGSLSENVGKGSLSRFAQCLLYYRIGKVRGSARPRLSCRAGISIHLQRGEHDVSFFMDSCDCRGCRAVDKFGKHCRSRWLWLLLLSATADRGHPVRQSAMQLLLAGSDCLRARLLHRSANGLLAHWYIRSPDRHLHLGLLWSYGEGRGHPPWQSESARLELCRHFKTK